MLYSLSKIHDSHPMKRTLSLLFFIFFLTACQASQTVPVNLTQEQRTTLENQGVQLQEELKQVEQELKVAQREAAEAESASEKETSEADLSEDEQASPSKETSEEKKIPEVSEATPEMEAVEEGVTTSTQKTSPASPEAGAEGSEEAKVEATLSPIQKQLSLTLRLARVYQDLGQLGKAITLYEDYLEEGNQSYAVLNNVARLHEQLGQPEKAIPYYERLLNEYRDPDYLRDIAKAYLAAGNVEKAEEIYQQWQGSSDRKDSNFERQLEQLKAGE